MVETHPEAHCRGQGHDGQVVKEGLGPGMGQSLASVSQTHWPVGEELACGEALSPADSILGSGESKRRNKI